MLLGSDVSSLLGSEFYSDTVSALLQEKKSNIIEGIGGKRYLAMRCFPIDSKDIGLLEGSDRDISSLENLGVLIIRIKEQTKEFIDIKNYNNQRIMLAGGSICNTYLYFKKGLVEKVIGSTVLEDVDGIGRHRREFEYIKSLSNKFRYLFPSIVTDKNLGQGDINLLTMEFLPGYTVGERVLRRELESATLCSLIEKLIGQLSKTLWISEPRVKQRDYFSIVRRRFQHLKSEKILRKLWDQGCRINDANVPAINELLDAAEKQWPILSCLEGTGAHGDLILDDIILIRKKKDCLKLVDPNPQNVSWFIDMSKLMMSAALGYELIYEGCYSISVQEGDHGLSITYQKKNAKALSILKELSKLLEQKVITISNLRKEEVGPIELQVQSCLNMLALPYFHFLQHGELNRSIAFCVEAMLKLDTILRTYPNNACQ